MTDQAAPVARRSRAQIWILCGVFFAPLLFAFLLYYGTGGWRPAGSTHHGTLVHPARPLPHVALDTPAGAQLPGSLWEGKWTLLYVGDGRCDSRCREALTLMRQTRLALNQDLGRIQRLFLAAEPCCDEQYLATEHAGLVVAKLGAPQAEPLRAALIQTVQGDPAGRIYLIDPLGNLVLHYGPGAPPKGLLEDLKKLLKLSHIG